MSTRLPHDDGQSRRFDPVERPGDSERRDPGERLSQGPSDQGAQRLGQQDGLGQDATRRRWPTPPETRSKGICHDHDAVADHRAGPGRPGL